MKSNENQLTTEIIKRILGNLGIVPNNFGKVGITTKEFLKKETINLKDEISNNIDYINLYAGEINISSTEKIKAACLNLSDNNINEFILVFRMINLPIYGLKLIFDNIDCGLFLIADDNLKWSNTNILNQSQILTGIEHITQEGLIWNSSNDYLDLYQAIKNIIEFY